MKKQLRQAMLATAALSFGLSAYAAEPTGKLTVAEDAPFQVTIDWEQKNPEDWALNIGRGATGRPNDKAVYVNAMTVSKIYKMDANGVTEYMETDGTGTSLASDDAGNLFWPAGAAGTGTQSHVFSVLPAGKTSMDDVVTIECDEPGEVGPIRADNQGRALGDFFSEEGAMVYTCPSTAKYVNAFWIKNGECAEASTSLELPAANATFQRAQPWATSVEEADATGAWDMCFYLYGANVSTILCPNEDFDGFETINRVDQRSAMAFDWFMLGGESYLVYGAKLPGKGATWCNGDIVIVRQSDNAIVASYEAAIENPSGQAYAGISCFPNEDGKSVTISVWNSRSGAYQLTVTLPGDPILPLYAVYEGQGWNPAEPVEFTYADGIYSYTFAEGTGKFKMSTTKGADWAAFEQGVICVADDKVIEDNTGETKYALYVGGNADIAFGYTEGQWTAYVDLANNLIWATNATDKPEPQPEFTGKLTVAEDAPFELKIDWEQANPEDWALNIGRGATGRPNDKAVYVNAYTVNKIYKMDANGVTEYMETDGTGTSIGSDNAGNLYWPAGGAGSADQSHIFKVLPTGKASMDDVVTIECDEPGEVGAIRADNYGRALGDFFSEEGAMVYTCPSTAKYVNAFWIKNGECAEASTSLELPAANATFQRAQPWATSVEEADATGAWDMCFYLYSANGNTIYYPNEDFDGFASVNRVDQRSAMAFDWFMLGGESYLVYGAKLPGKGASWCNGDIVIVRQSDNAIVASYEAAIENPSGQAYAGISCFPNEDNNSVTISVWNSRSGAYQLTATLPQQETPALYAAYAGQGWNPGEPVEFNYANGVYSYTFAEGTGEFKMSTTKGVDANDWAGFEQGVICVADDKKLEDNTGETKYALYVGGNANINFGYTDGQWTAYVDLANGLIWATNATNKPVASGKLYIVGIDGSFDAANPTEMAYDEAKNVFTIDVPAAPYGFKLSTEKGSWDKFNAAGFHTEADIVPNEVTALLPGSPSGNMNTTATAPYTIEVAGDYSTIKVVKGEEINVPASLAVIGELAAGKWNTTAVAPLELKEDGYTFYGEVDMAGGWFSLCEKAAATEGDWAGVGTRYGAAVDGTEVANKTAVAFQQGTNAFNIVSFSDYPKKLYFTVDFKEMTVVVSDEPTAVEAIDADNNAAVEYYNLQGIRVNEPVKGQFYIVRKGNEVSKIVL